MLLKGARTALHVFEATSLRRDDKRQGTVQRLVALSKGTKIIAVSATPLAVVTDLTRAGVRAISLPSQRLEASLPEPPLAPNAIPVGNSDDGFSTATTALPKRAEIKFHFNDGAVMLSNPLRADAARDINLEPYLVSVNARHHHDLKTAKVPVGTGEAATASPRDRWSDREGPGLLLEA